MAHLYEADKGQFVPAIESIVVSWFNRLETRLNDDLDSKWTEEFLNVISDPSGRDLKLHVQVGLHCLEYLSVVKLIA
jgi:hypothetical protein